MIGTKFNHAFSKLLFCFRICSDLKSLLCLLRNTKKFSKYYRSDSNHQSLLNEVERSYNLDLPNGKHSVYLRTLSGDLGIFYEVFWLQIYLLEIERKDNRLIIVDAGAHIGMASLFFLQHYKTASVYSIEPDSSNVRLLRKNLSAEIAGRQVTVIPCAISEKEGTALLDNSGWSYNSKLKESSHLSVEGEYVTVRTMESIIREYNINHIDLLKIDIEGSESGLFANKPDWLKLVEILMIEIHSEDIKNTIRTTLLSYGFSFEKWNLNPHGDVYLAKKQGG
jgi:FkbM family methyltransferase